MKTIVIGYDGSDESKDALRLAADLRKATGAELIVSPVDEIEPYFGDMNLEQLGENRQDYFRRMFDDAAEQLGDSDFTRVTGAGSAPAALEQIAQVHEADVVVVGSTHRAGVAKVLPGSTATRLLSGSPCAVAVAPRGYASERKDGIKHIGVAYDGQREAELALDAAIELGRDVGADLRLIAVNLNPTQISAGHGGSISPEAYVDSLDGYLKEQIADGLARIPGGIESSSVIRSGHPEDELAEEGAKLDLLVIGSRGYGPVRRVLLGGTANKVITTATCPVMVVPRSTVETSEKAQTHSMSGVVV
jgi:nucleotide-binding universal stress UspA family protein